MQSTPLRCSLIGAGNRWRHGYHPWICKNRNVIDIVAIAEPMDERRNFYKNIYGLSSDACFEHWRSMLAQSHCANIDAIIICASDSDHYEPAMACLHHGYDILLEKPMAQNARQCIDIVNAAQHNNRKVLLAHVLRYTPFFTKVRALISSGAIGAVQSIQHTEQVGYFHIAHSFVRGNWSSAVASNPIILAKSCHDLDILLYILGDGVRATSVASFGALRYFTADHAPHGAPHQCSHVCPAYERCPYSVRVYLNARNYSPIRDPHIALNEENLAQLMKDNPYGRCVYHCDNDVCDSMSTIIEFDNGIHATFTLSGFTDEETRTINVMGSHGHIVGNMEQDELHLMRFGKGSGSTYNKACTTYHPHADAANVENSGYAGHGGGDTHFIIDFVKSVSGDGLMLTDSALSLHSHLMGFAIEEARRNKTVVLLDEFMARHHA